MPIHTQGRPSPIQSNHRKTAYALRENATAFVERHDLNRCGFLNLTFKGKVWPEPASVCLKKAVRSFHDHFQDWIWTMGLGRNFRIHYHILLATGLDIRTGVDLSAYPKLLSLEVGYDSFSQWVYKEIVPIEERRGQLYAALSTNENLLHLRAQLYPRLRDAGFGQQILLSPIFTDGPTIADYMQKNYLETVTGRNGSFRGQRLVGYKQGSERRCPSYFAWTGSSGWRLALQRIAQALGVDDYTHMSPTFGSRWGFRIGFLMAELQARYGDQPDRWPTMAIVSLSANTMPKEAELSHHELEDDAIAAAA